MDDKKPYTTGIDSDALRSPRRIVFLTKKTSGKVFGERPGQVMSYPHLILREAITLQAMVIVLVLLSLFWDAPLEQLANPLLTPNPAKAPWYFLGLQELLHYFPPLVAGIILPGLVIVALIVIPYFEVNIKGEPFWSGNRRKRLQIFCGFLLALLIVLTIYEAWTVLAPTLVVSALLLSAYFARAEGGKLREYLKSRPISWWVMTWFICVSVILTVVGTFFRGPGWSWVWPWT
jgi:quinol---cytochrome c reductase cytochrome c subunit, bacillus type